MKNIIVIIFTIFNIQVSNAQSNTSNLIDTSYFRLTAKGLSFFEKKDYQNAIENYNIAFKNNNDRGFVKDRYIVACCFTKLNMFDSSFSQLFRIANKGGYYNINQLENEQYFMILHNDFRWQNLCNIVKENARKIDDK